MITVLQPRNPGELRSGRGLGVRSLRFIAFLCYLTILLSAVCGRAQNVTTWHVDNARTGVQQNETILTPSNVNSTLFGKLFTFPVLGDVYAEPLYIYQYTMSDGNLHNVLIVATEEDVVYAFDADGNNPSQGYLWESSLLGSGETYVSASDVGVVDISPNLGITGTPVIDHAGGVIYVVARSKTSSSPTTFYQRLHALNLADGTEVLNGPTTIAATAPGTGGGGASVSFDPLYNNQRSALLLAPTPSGPTANSVFIAFASNGDTTPYHGWLISYDAANISTQTGAWVSTPNGMKGGIWMSGGGPSSDNAGNIFFGVANGTFDAASSGGDYGESELHLAISGTGLAVADSFTPFNQAALTGSNGLTADKDMGMAAPLLLPAQSGPLANLLVTADKSGTIYLINADAMGGYLTSQDSSVQDFPDSVSKSIHSGFAFLNNTLFVGPDEAQLMAFTFDPNAQLFSTTPSSVSSATFGTCAKCYVSGPTPSISAKNGANGIVWALDNSIYNNDPAILHAYDATNLASELYNSTQASNNRDTGGIAIKFTTPTIANGHVYVGGRNAVTAYGLLPLPQTATPTFSLAGGTYTGTQTVSILDSTTNASIYYTTDGSTPTVNSTQYTGSFQVSASETVSAIATASSYTQSAVAQAQYTIGEPQAATPTFSLASGSYTGTQTVSILDSTPKAYLYYTTDGTAPSVNSTPYTGSFQVAASETISAIATASGYTQSAVAQAQYTIGAPQAATPTFSLASGSYTGTQTVSILDGTAKASIYYTTNGTIPTVNSTPYTGSFQVSASETISAIATASGYTQSAVAQAQYTIGAPQAAPPTFSLASGTYTGTQTVSILDGTAKASIYYTTNGTIPTVNSTHYTSSVQVSASETISAIAIASGYTQSAVAQAKYTISVVPPPPSLVEVSLSSVANLVGIVPDGTKFTSLSLNRAGCNYSENLLHNPFSYAGVRYAIGAANGKDVVMGGKVIPLPAGNYASLYLLALAVQKNQYTPLVFTVTYSDKSTEVIKQSLSDWVSPQHYAGESIALTMPYCDNTSGGKTAGSHYLYQYTFALNRAKTVTSLTVPANSDVIVVAATLGSPNP